MWLEHFSLHGARSHRPRGRVRGPGCCALYALNARDQSRASVHASGTVTLLAVVIVTPRPYLENIRIILNSHHATIKNGTLFQITPTFYMISYRMVVEFFLMLSCLTNPPSSTPSKVTSSSIIT